MYRFKERSCLSFRCCDSFRRVCWRWSLSLEGSLLLVAFVLMTMVVMVFLRGSGCGVLLQELLQLEALQSVLLGIGFHIVRPLFGSGHGAAFRAFGSGNLTACVLLHVISSMR